MFTGQSFLLPLFFSLCSHGGQGVAQSPFCGFMYIVESGANTCLLAGVLYVDREGLIHVSI